VYLAQIALREVGSHPYRVGHCKRDDRRLRCDEISRLDNAFTDNARHRRIQLGVPDGLFRLCQHRIGGGNAGGSRQAVSFSLIRLIHGCQLAVRHTPDALIGQLRGMCLRLCRRKFRAGSIIGSLQPFGMQARHQLSRLYVITFIHQYFAHMLAAIEGQAHLADINVAVKNKIAGLDRTPC
jgi:hypothetical protein